MKRGSDSKPTRLTPLKPSTMIIITIIGIPWPEPWPRRCQLQASNDGSGEYVRTPVVVELTSRGGALPPSDTEPGIHWPGQCVICSQHESHYMTVVSGKKLGFDSFEAALYPRMACKWKARNNQLGRTLCHIICDSWTKRSNRGARQPRV